MFENIFKGLRGPWGILAILVAATPTGRKYAKLAAREIVRAGIVAAEKVKEVAAEIKEEGADIVAELQEERANELLGEGNHKKSRKEAANA
jgi:pheromone shutdown protein TraB